MKRMETRLGSRKEDLSETSFFDDIWQIQIYRRNVSQRKHNANESITLCKQIHMLKLGVFDVVVIFTAGNAGRLEELKKR
ncbi:hypothetical protein V1478_004290 [Vespula squamosa]|uniref:Uncharacterized protein n=1 Tax=Vespula squamosa TaxID=30214 RepID=A0ABD2BD19_VESSQ